MADIAYASSLTDPLYNAWKQLRFEEKWGNIYQAGSLSQQNVGQVMNLDGISGLMELIYKERGTDKGIFIQLVYHNEVVDIQVFKIEGLDGAFKKSEGKKVTLDSFDDYITTLVQDILVKKIVYNDVVRPER